MAMALNVETSGGGATGFSSLSRGLTPQRSFVPSVSTVPMGGERTINPREGAGISRGDILRTLASPRTISTRTSMNLRPVDPQPIFEPALEPRGLGDTRGPITRDSGVRTIVPPPRSIGEPRAPLGGRDMSGRPIISSGVSGAGSNAGTNQPRTPFDEQLETLFRGYFGEPVRGSADKAGEFVYFPQGTSGGMSGGMILLIVAGLGVAGYYAYKKFGRGE